MHPFVSTKLATTSISKYTVGDRVESAEYFNIILGMISYFSWQCGVK